MTDITTSTLAQITSSARPCPEPNTWTRRAAGGVKRMMRRGSPEVLLRAEVVVGEVVTAASRVGDVANRGAVKPTRREGSERGVENRHSCAVRVGARGRPIRPLVKLHPYAHIT